MSFGDGQIVGEYKVIGLLGRGGLGTVYQAMHLISQRVEAMKVLLPEQTGTAEMAERFRREIQLLAALNHPNIAALHHAFYFGEQLVMIMELIEGEDLRSRSRRTRIALDLLVQYAAQVLRALAYAHGRGVVHRDIKPANLMISPNGVVKVLDFGIAVSERSRDLTAVGSLIGSPTHMSPEQIRGEKATPQSDLYALGVTLYELIAGQPPLDGATTYELMMAHLERVPVPLHERRGDIPEYLSSAIARALEKKPEDRFASASEFLAALQAQPAAGTEHTTTVEPAASWQRVTTDELQRPPENTSVNFEPLIRNLATFIGPIAKVVVSRLVKQGFHADQMYIEAAKQIDSEKDRQKFLRNRPR